LAIFGIEIRRTAANAANRPNYLSDLEILTALVTNLAMTDWWHRTPGKLARSLSIPEPDISRVLETYKGLFRKSPNVSKETKSPLYTLQLRYARQWMQRDTEDEGTKPPLDSEYLVALLDFISRRADEETRRSYTVTAAIIAAGVAVLASLANIIVTLVSTGGTTYLL
jgi:hypothetical protein